jgi:hypothetical protein
MSYDCFISYASRSDLPEAEALYNALTQAGHTVWFDRVRIRAGFNWHHEIEAGLNASRVVLPVLTPDWKNSLWTRYETYGAERVIPLLYKGRWEDVKTPPLEAIQGQLISPVDIPRLLAALKEVLAQTPVPRAERLARLPFPPSRNFVGREKELNQIHEMLFRNPTAVLTQGHIAAVTALGGVGKTTLAPNTPKSSGEATGRSSGLTAACRSRASSPPSTTCCAPNLPNSNPPTRPFRSARNLAARTPRNAC